MNHVRFYKLPADVAAREDLSGNDKVLYAVLADKMGGNGRAWPGFRLWHPQVRRGEFAWACGGAGVFR